MQCCPAGTGHTELCHGASTCAVMSVFRWRPIGILSSCPKHGGYVNINGEIALPVAGPLECCVHCQCHHWVLAYAIGFARPRATIDNDLHISVARRYKLYGTRLQRETGFSGETRASASPPGDFHIGFASSSDVFVL